MAPRGARARGLRARPLGPHRAPEKLVARARLHRDDELVHLTATAEGSRAVASRLSLSGGCKEGVVGVDGENLYRGLRAAQEAEHPRKERRQQAVQQTMEVEKHDDCVVLRRVGPPLARLPRRPQRQQGWDEKQFCGWARVLQGGARLLPVVAPWQEEVERLEEFQQLPLVPCEHLRPPNGGEQLGVQQAAVPQLCEVARATLDDTVFRGQHARRGVGHPRRVETHELTQLFRRGLGKMEQRPEATKVHQEALQLRLRLEPVARASPPHLVHFAERVHALVVRALQHRPEVRPPKRHRLAEGTCQQVRSHGVDDVSQRLHGGAAVGARVVHREEAQLRHLVDPQVLTEAWRPRAERDDAVIH
mmetsp:Transcript_92420/g.266820  ORF Transcript_92420/g.266820 Transcript_92420/m.266820 type:complete len:362 (+) Transcript_92420:656-1741(+)